MKKELSVFGVQDIHKLWRYLKTQDKRYQRGKILL